MKTVARCINYLQSQVKIEKIQFQGNISFLLTDLLRNHYKQNSSDDIRYNVNLCFKCTSRIPQKSLLSSDSYYDSNQKSSVIYFLIFLKDTIQDCIDDISIYWNQGQNNKFKLKLRNVIFIYESEKEHAKEINQTAPQNDIEQQNI